VGRFYITTPIYYVNDAPHIGHAYTTVNADALARWHRLVGDDVYFLTGTDEHGTKIQRAAEAAGETPQQLADRVSVRFRECWQLLNITNDDFIRTTDERHVRGVQKFLQTVYDNGDIVKDTYKGLYCVPCEAYYTEDDLVEGNCPIHKRPVELVEEENYFFKLSRYEDRLLTWLQADDNLIVPPAKKNEVIGFIKQGLQDFSVSRTSISWGVPIPWDTKHVTYVWFDALTNYLTAIGYGTDDAWQQWWSSVHHLMAKDIIRFHAVYWPAMLMSAGIEPPKQYGVSGYLLVGGEKMSKTRLNQILPSDLVADFGVDGVRYHFLRDVSFGSDGDFSYEGLQARFNTDLANNLGNLFSRVATVVGKKCGGIGPAPDPNSSLRPIAEEVLAGATAAWNKLAPHEALDITWRLLRETNSALEVAAPWKSEPGPEVDASMGDALEVLRIVSILASPALPTTTAEIWRRLGLSGSPDQQRLPEAAAWGGYPGGLPVEKGESLFPRKS